MESVIRPLRPKDSGWDGPFPVPPQYTMGYEGYTWQNEKHGLFVMSCVEVARDKDNIDRGPEYHISISKQLAPTYKPQRCSSAEASWVLDQFSLAGAEEDNHVPNGVVRNFWRTVAEPMIGLECGCKETEQAVVEGDYIWRP